MISSLQVFHELENIAQAVFGGHPISKLFNNTQCVAIGELDATFSGLS
jgi:hypothetical protein